jgi:hypothetical protein
MNFKEFIPFFAFTYNRISVLHVLSRYITYIHAKYEQVYVKTPLEGEKIKPYNGKF